MQISEVKKPKELVEEFLGIRLEEPYVIRISEPNIGFYFHDVIFLGRFEDYYDEERVLVHELAHYAQDVLCKPRINPLHIIIGAFLILFGVFKGKFVRFLRFTEGFATWVEESILGQRKDWHLAPRYYYEIYYKGAEQFRRMKLDEAVKFGLKNKEFCKKIIYHKNIL
jgi:hypothetical protein